MYEVRRTADSEAKRVGSQACPEHRSIAGTGAHMVGGGGMSRSACDVNQGYLSRCWKERDRSQSPHRSEEAGNDRGAKEDRKVEA